MPKKITCPKCGSEAYYAIVHNYVWMRPGKSDTRIKDAKIIRCGHCGEIPASKEERVRWSSISKKKYSIDYFNEDQCDRCACLVSETGQFYKILSPGREIIEKLCKYCYEKKYNS